MRRGGEPRAAKMKADMNTRAKSRLLLLEAELERLVEFAVGEFAAERVILFGSMAGPRSEVGEWTDLDLVIVAETNLPFHRRAGEILRKARPEVGADIFVYTPPEWGRMKSESPFIKEDVLGKGKVVYERRWHGRVRECLCYDSRCAGIGFL